MRTARLLHDDSACTRASVPRRNQSKDGRRKYRLWSAESTRENVEPDEPVGRELETDTAIGAGEKTPPTGQRSRYTQTCNRAVRTAVNGNGNRLIIIVNSVVYDRPTTSKTNIRCRPRRIRYIRAYNDTTAMRYGQTGNRTTHHAGDR